MATVDDGISLRPLSLRPGGGANPFKSFGKGAGIGLKHATTSAVSEKKKPRSEVQQYSREFLMKFAEKYTQLPSELAYSSVDILLDPNDPGREAQRALLQKVAADESDERDWRARSSFAPQAAGAVGPAANAAGQAAGAASGAAAGAAAAPAAGGAPAAAGGAPRASPTAGAPLARAPRHDGPGAIQRAADVGKTAWTAGGQTAEGQAATMKTIKGILNKLTPEKFERLLAQIVPLLLGYEVVEATISRVFEAAVAQPTFVAMYADLCAELDAVLPELRDPSAGALTSFKKMLANTCQTEYEATEAARAAAALAGSPAEREDAERVAKQRLLGNIRLISELFKKGVVNDRIMLLILRDLLAPPAAKGAQLGGSSENAPLSASDVPVEAVEAVCELLTTAGAALEKNERAKPRLDAAFAALAAVAGDKRYPSRVRFVIRDVLDLRQQRWVPRREAFTAKKLEEVHAEAAAELGLDVAIAGLDVGGGLGALGGLRAAGAGPAAPGALAGLRPLAGLAPARAGDVELFPAFKSDDASWAGARAAARGGVAGDFSAFLGAAVQLAPRGTAASTSGGAAGNAPPAAAAPALAAAAPSSAVAARADLSDEQRESLAKSVFSDYVADGKVDEAERAARELATPGFPARLAEIGLRRAYDAVDKKESAKISELLAELVRRGVVAGRDAEKVTADLAATLADDAVDYRSAPAILGAFFGAVLAAKAAEASLLATALSQIEDAEPRRALFVATAKASGVTKADLAASSVDLPDLLAADPEFEKHLPDVALFLKDQGLEALL